VQVENDTAGCLLEHDQCMPCAMSQHICAV